MNFLQVSKTTLLQTALLASIVVLLVLPFHSKANGPGVSPYFSGNWLHDSYYGDSTNSVVFETLFGSYSNALTTQFIRDTYLGSNDFNDNLTSSQIGNIKSNNKYEDRLMGGIGFLKSGVDLPGLGVSDISFNYKVRTERKALFTRDAFYLAFLGNALFEGDTADVDDLNIDHYLINQLQFTIRKHHSLGEKTFTWGLGASFLMGQSHLSAEINKGGVYTAPAGEFIQIGYNADIRNSQNIGGNLFTDAGKGFSIDFLGQLSGDKGTWTFTAEDLSYLWWDNHSSVYQADTQTIYEGIIIDNLFDLTNQEISEISTDSIFDILGIDEQRKGYIGNLTPTFDLSHHRPLLDNRLQIQIGVRYKLLEKYLPLVYAAGYYRFNEKNYLGLKTSVLGYGGWHWGFEAGHRFGDNFRVTLGSNALPGMIAQKKLTGASLYLRSQISF